MPYACVWMTLWLGSLPLAWSQASDTLDETARSAALLLRRCIAVDRQGLHEMMLSTIRHLRDPALEPLFHRLTQSPHPALKVHGFLGLARCDPNQQLDMIRIAALKDPAIQAQVISAAMDDKLLTNQQSQQLLDWPGLDTGVKIIVAAQLVQSQQFSDIQLLRQAMSSDNLARKGLAALLMLQLGHDQGLDDLYQLDQSEDRQRDQVRRMLLETALRYDLNGVAPWATRVSSEPNVLPKLGLLALRVAMRFGSPGAIDLWRHQFESATDPARRTRLALLAMALSPWLDPGLFQPWVNDQDPLVRRIFRTGLAIASDHQIDAAVVGLIEMHHPLMNRWALSYARQHATDDHAQVILLGLIMAFEDRNVTGRNEPVNEVVQAARVLHERCPQAAVALLRPILAEGHTDPLLAEGILMGLLLSTQPHPDRVLAGLPGSDNPRVHNLAILLLAKHGQTLSDSQARQLQVLVRGGGGIGQAMRLQAAWAYLKQTQQSQRALATALGM